MKKLILNLLFYPLLMVLTLIFFLVLTLPVLYMKLTQGERQKVKFVRIIISKYGYVVSRYLTFPFVRIDYKDYEEGRKLAPCVYVANHRSSSDPFLMSNLNIEAIQLVNLWPFRMPVFGFMAKLAGYISIRALSFEEFLRRGRKLISEGVSIIVFPEGSRTGDRHMSQFNGAVFRLALDVHCPIVPICVTGNENIPPKGSYLLNSGVIKMRKLPALEWETYKDLGSFSLKNKVRDMIQQETKKMEVAC